MLAAGDNLINITILNDAKKDGYNFAPIYSQIAPLIQSADTAFINQETILGGSQFNYSGYPQFNTPSTMAQALASAGFTVVNHANNHTMDMGEAGILAAMDTWDSFPEIAVLGIHRGSEKQPCIITKNNISLGFLSYTYGTNGIPLPRNKPWIVSMIDRKVMAAEIDSLRPLCDFLAVSIHWGDEYSFEPTAVQTELAQFLASHNVDVVIGHHPHVLQRMEYLPRPDGGQTVCFYSLGNFANNQDRAETALGGLAYVQFVKQDDELSIGVTGIIPVISHFETNFTKTQVIPYYAYTDELLQKHRGVSRHTNFSKEYFETILAALNTNIYRSNPFENNTGATSQAHGN